MELLNYLKEKELNSLSDEFNVKITPSLNNPELVCLTYSQLNTPKNDVTNDCRGILINKNTLEVVALPFTRFNDYNDESKTFDYNNFKVYEKIDGSLMTLYYYNGKWNVGTKGTCDASGIIREYGKSYSEMFWNVFNELNYKLPSDTDITYIFELKFVSNFQFITQTKENTLVLIGARNIKTFKEIDIDTIDANFIKVEPILSNISISDLLDNTKKLNPLICEGYVIVDKNFNRFKVKSPVYELISLLQNLTEYNVNKTSDIIKMNKKRFTEILFYTDNEDFLCKFESVRNHYNDLKTKKIEILNQLNETYEQVKDYNDKELGAFCKTNIFGKYIFQIRKAGNVNDFVYNNIKTFCGLMEVSI